MFDVVHVVVVEFFKGQSLDVRSLLLSPSLSIFLLRNFLSRSSSLMMLIFPMFCSTPDIVVVVVVDDASGHRIQGIDHLLFTVVVVVVVVVDLLGHHSSKSFVVVDVAAHLQRLYCC